MPFLGLPSLAQAQALSETFAQTAVSLQVYASSHCPPCPSNPDLAGFTLVTLEIRVSEEGVDVVEAQGPSHCLSLLGVF